jgi:cytochrome c-type biogenesis protein CcmH
MKRALVVALCVAAALSLQVFAQPQAPDAAQFVGAPKGTPLTGDALNLRAHQVSALLRCPVCQGLSVADSPAEMAVNMKGQVRDLLSRGYTEEQILQYFELSYGQFVRLKPTFQGVNVLVWLLPVVVLVGGVAVVMVKMKKLSVARTPAAEPKADAGPVEDPYVAQVRELVGGGKR